ncbi:MAG TPA: serine hydrolase domain-containing protein [Thermoanaerobaculia bacterium]|nr:serine hydrolase domain-containing protein [Thermoanaerobaculia bacterium]
MTLGPWGTAIQSFLGSGPVGWAYAIGQNGALLESGAVGYAVAPWDKNGTEEQFTTSTGIPFASCSKSITAVAMMNLFENPPSGWSWGDPANLLIMLDETFNLYTSAAISGPGGGPSWDPGAGVAGVTIGQLMTMFSGMNPASGSNLFDPYMTAMTKYVQTPCVGVPGQGSSYINANFGILELVLAGMQGSTDPGQYQTYVQDNVFTPMGITDVQDAPFFNTSTYASGQASGSGYVWPQVTSSLSSGGWCGTVLDLANFLMGIRNNKVLTSATTQLMFNLQLGWYPMGLDNGEYAWWHNGGLYNTDASPNPGLMTMIMSMPSGIDAAWVCNTWGPWDWYKCLAAAWNTVYPDNPLDPEAVVKRKGREKAMRQAPKAIAP